MLSTASGNASPAPTALAPIRLRAPGLSVPPPRQGSALLLPREVAKRLGIAVKTLQVWRRERRGPRFVKLSGRVVRYHPADVDTFVGARGPASAA